MAFMGCQDDINVNYPTNSGSKLNNGLSLLGTLGDRVWKDKNKNGVQDDGEYGIKDVKVQLYNCNGQLIAATYTNYYGNYSFSNVYPGKYKVKFFAPSDLKFTKKDQGSNAGKDSDVDPATGFTTCITFGSGLNDCTWDAGLYWQ